MDAMGREINGRKLDDAGRVVADALTPEEATTELVILMRGFADALTALSSSPMAAAMLPGLSGLGR